MFIVHGHVSDFVRGTFSLYSTGKTPNCFVPVHMKTTFPILSVLLLSLTLAIAAARPNFVIIMADDMGYADASCYGNDRYQTPRIDQLAKEGLRFIDFHSNGPVCSPTRAALLTGRYQQRAGMAEVVFADPKQNRHHGLQAQEVTFAEHLGRAGYRTGVMGKWHLGYARSYNPVDQGFDEFHGYVSGNIDFHSHYDRMGVLDWWDGGKLADEPGYCTHLITHYAKQFIHENKDRPFCLYIAHEAPHNPYQGPHDKAFRVADKVVKETHPPGHIEKAYREMMQEMDTGIGEVIDTLKELKLEKNTFVFFFSDNGATPKGNNGPLRGSKSMIWEGGHRVPAIAWWPDRIQPGTTTDATAITLDVLPTLLDLAGIRTAQPSFDGVSLTPTLFGSGQLPSRSLFWEYRDRKAIRKGPWKLLVNQPIPGKKYKNGDPAKVAPMLFNLQKDLGELNDLSAKQPERVKSLLAELSRWEAEVNMGATAQPAR
jgi:arylsulfatase A